jgi:hypothetical protein
MKKEEEIQDTKPEATETTYTTVGQEMIQGRLS